MALMSFPGTPPKKMNKIFPMVPQVVDFPMGKITKIIWVVVVSTPLKNMTSSLGLMTFPTE
jgi:hypothetical protein